MKVCLSQLRDQISLLYYCAKYSSNSQQSRSKTAVSEPSSDVNSYIYIVPKDAHFACATSTSYQRAVQQSLVDIHVVLSDEDYWRLGSHSGMQESVEPTIGYVTTFNIAYMRQTGIKFKDRPPYQE